MKLSAAVLGVLSTLFSLQVLAVPMEFDCHAAPEIGKLTKIEMQSKGNGAYMGTAELYMRNVGVILKVVPASHDATKLSDISLIAAETKPQEKVLGELRLLSDDGIPSTMRMSLKIPTADTGVLRISCVRR